MGLQMCAERKKEKTTIQAYRRCFGDKKKASRLGVEFGRDIPRC